MWSDCFVSMWVWGPLFLKKLRIMILIVSLYSNTLQLIYYLTLDHYFCAVHHEVCRFTAVHNQLCSQVAGKTQILLRQCAYWFFAQHVTSAGSNVHKAVHAEVGIQVWDYRCQELLGTYSIFSHQFCRQAVKME